MSYAIVAPLGLNTVLLAPWWYFNDTVEISASKEYERVK